MSIVVAVRKNHEIVMSADSMTCFGDAQCIPAANSATNKIRRVNGTLIGGAGWGIYDAIIEDYLSQLDVWPDLDGEAEIFAFFLDLWKALHDRYPFVNDQAQSRDSPFGDLDSSFLLANHTGLYKVSHDMDVCAFQQYYAIGSGSEYALGALYNNYDGAEDASTIARSAVETAIQFDLHCGAPVNVQRVVETTDIRSDPGPAVA